MRSALSAGLVAVGLLVSVGVSAAGFDCNLASTKVEKQICANPEISNLDYELNKVYKAVSSFDGVKQGQRDWVKNVRNQTPNDSIMVIVYKQRIDELKGLIKPVEPVKVEPIKVEPVEVVAEPVKVEPVKPTSKEVLKYHEAAQALALAKACDQKDLFEYDYEEYRGAVLDEIKAELGDRYSPEVMRVSYQKVYGKIMQSVVKSPEKLAGACNAVNTTIDSMVEAMESEEMEF